MGYFVVPFPAPKVFHRWNLLPYLWKAGGASKLSYGRYDKKIKLSGSKSKIIEKSSGHSFERPGSLFKVFFENSRVFI